MKVVALTSRLPWPLEKGDKLRLYHQLKAMSAAAEVHLICLVHEEPSEEAREAILPWVHALHTIPLSHYRRAARMLWSPLSTRPFQVHWFYQRKAQRQVDKLIREIQPHCIWSQLIRTAEYVKEHHEVPRTLDYMDALSAGMKRRAEKHRGPFRWLLALEARRLTRYESSVFDYFDAHAIITEADQQAIGHPDRHRIAIVPNGVDTQYFSPKPTLNAGATTVSFIGNMAYPPNVDAAIRLIREVKPLVPAPLKWVVAGATPTASVRGLDGKDVTVTGWMEDIRDAYHASHIFAAPIVLGSGQQNKILEAMACGLPCVVSPQVSQGLGHGLRVVRGPLDDELLHSAHAVLADSPEEFAERIMELNQAELWRQILGRNARSYVEEHASWSVETAKLLATFAYEPGK
jgi:glycosyltransferase involved in cell wall biosynthesis